MTTDLRGVVTFIFTTLGRPDAAKRLIASVRKYFTNLRIIVADQNDPTDEMRSYYEEHSVDVLWVPYDCGLSYARNRAVEAVSTPFVLLGDDDFVFTEQSDLSAALEILNAEQELGVVGGSIIDVYPGENDREYRQLRRFEKFLVHLEKYRTLVSLPIDYLAPQSFCVAGRTAYRCDMTLNWAVFRREVFDQGCKWDEVIKINGEHEDFFLSLQRHGVWGVAYFPGLQCEHRQITSPSYQALRGRVGGRAALAKKWGLEHHLQVGVGLRDFRRYHEFEETSASRSDLYRWEGLGAPDNGHLPPKGASYLRMWDDGHATAYEGPIDFTESALEALQRRLEATLEELAANEKSLAQMGGELVRRDEELAANNKRLTQMEGELVRRDEAQAALNEQILALKQSHSWRITRPLRAAKSWITAAGRHSSRRGREK